MYDDPKYPQYRFTYIQAFLIKRRSHYLAKFLSPIISPIKPPQLVDKHISTWWCIVQLYTSTITGLYVLQNE